MLVVTIFPLDFSGIITAIDNITSRNDELTSCSVKKTCCSWKLENWIEINWVNTYTSAESPYMNPIEKDSKPTIEFSQRMATPTSKSDLVVAIKKNVVWRTHRSGMQKLY